MFTAIGTLHGRTVSISWHRGKIIAAPEIVASIEELAYLATRQNREIGPMMGPFVEKNYLRYPMSAAILIEEYLDSVQQWSGDVPTPEPVSGIV